MGFPEEAMERVFVNQGFNLGRFNAHYENWATTLNLLGICFCLQVARLYSIQNCAEIYSAATGIVMAPEAMIIAAERVWNVYKTANVREGFERKNDSFPRKWFTPQKHKERELIIRDYFSGEPLTEADLEQLLDDYYNERGWDVERGIPTKEKLLNLGLQDIAQDIEKYF